MHTGEGTQPSPFRFHVGSTEWCTTESSCGEAVAPWVDAGFSPLVWSPVGKPIPMLQVVMVTTEALVAGLAGSLLNPDRDTNPAP